MPTVRTLDFKKMSMAAIRSNNAVQPEKKVGTLDLINVRKDSEETVLRYQRSCYSYKPSYRARQNDKKACKQRTARGIRNEESQLRVMIRGRRRTSIAIRSARSKWGEGRVFVSIRIKHLATRL